ncbi:phage head-tail connector protein [Limosilactobacillus sp. RRLNB_1_1]|uniref:Phage head-tail connector protein n=1 Tax=Limosilactobacillus albertensis TaxID=2759752 RepID=A0A7W3TRT2_9LACO|nr:phage head-tail connector protein [Limosilactobacillus albertensis]MBB1069690.1 phage head-tail connector protein [Limosilactobacillus albertensis]MCD7117911.1 phage head-tail connector protein [Limosilactobacillus albertensis]MCD7129537.1 phage head-tail connector protein [Limosilactobacillus albertensis]
MDQDAVLKNLKVMLGIKDDDRDALLKLIIDNTDQALRFKLELTNDEKIPGELEYIELEVSVRRFNRLQNEGMSQYSQEGESITFNSSDFDDFLDDIDLWKRRNQKDVKSLGAVSFINPYAGMSKNAKNADN